MLSSPRRRRRVVRSSLVVGALGVLLAVGLLFPNTAKRRPDAPLEAAPTLVPETSAREVQLGGATPRAALGTAQRFLRTAVLRRRVSESWALVHPVLRQGLSRAEWSTGDIPVVPYPVDEARWRLGYSRRDTIGLEVYVAPGEGSKVAPMVFDLELTALGSGAGRRWLVSSWAPRGGGLTAAPPGSARREAAERRALASREAHSLGPAWLLAPIMGIVAALLLPLGFLALRNRRRSARAEEAFRRDRDEHLASRRAPLP